MSKTNIAEHNMEVHFPYRSSEIIIKENKSYGHLPYVKPFEHLCKLPHPTFWQVNRFKKFPYKENDLFRCNCGNVFMFRYNANNSYINCSCQTCKGYCDYWKTSDLEVWKRYGGIE